MGWFSDIFKKRPSEQQPKPTQLKSEISIEDVEVEVKRRLAETESKLEPEIKNLNHKLTERAREFSEAMSYLESAKGPEKIDTRLMDISRSYVSAITKSFGPSISDMLKESTGPLSELRERLNRISKSFVDAEKASGRYIPTLKEVFPKETIRLQKASERIEEAISDSGKLMEKISGELRPLTDLISAIEAFRSQSSKLSESESELSVAVSSLESLKTRKVQIEARMAEIASSEEWAIHQTRLGELSNLRRKKSDVESVILQSIVSIERPMRKLKKAVEDGKESVGDPDILDSYISNPMEAFMRDMDQKGLREIASKIKYAAGRGVIEINDKKEDKTFERVSAIESGTLLPSLRADYETVDRLIEEVETKIKSSPVVTENSKLAEDLKSVLSDIVRAETLVNRVREITDKVRQKRDDALAKLETQTRIAIGGNIKISLPN